jgi:EAL and modified HD-GYP domain-containing signal transduction protein
MDVYVARQPIFDKRMGIVGYELLYRRSMNNFFEGVDDNQATADLINNAFLVMQFSDLTSGTRAYINFSAEMLLNEIPLLLPKETVVVEILERVEPSAEIIEACQRLKAVGYTIALDDFSFEESSIPLLELADIIKVEFPVVDFETQHKFLRKYGKRVKFLAEKVETREEYQMAAAMGYDYFQGFFFSMPVIEKKSEIVSIPSTLIRLMTELNQKDPDYRILTNIIETDVGLSYKLLKLAGSVYYGSRYGVYTISLALTRLGLIETRKWVYLLLMKNVRNIENKELVTTCLIRAKFMELLALKIGKEDEENGYFLAGLFSSIHVLLDCTMEDALMELPISSDVKNALLGQENDIKRALNLVLNYELGKWDMVDAMWIKPDMDREDLMRMYVEALHWKLKLDF